MTPASPRPSSVRPRQVAALVLLALCLVAGYAAVLRVAAQLPWSAAAWQASVCLAASPALLALVIKVISFPKRRWLLSRAAIAVTGWTIGIAQFVLPWLGWSALLWLMNRGALGLPAALSAGAGVAALSYIAGGCIIAILRPRARDVHITRHDIPIPGLPQAFDGYQILHLSDLHAGASLSVAGVGARLGRADSIMPDLVVFTGDLADSSPGRAEAVAKLLGAVPGGDGIVAVLGNHDHWVGEEVVAKALARAGIALLANSNRTVSRGGATLHLAGVKDASYMRRDDLPSALAGIPDDAPVVLLSHTPDIILQPLAERASLILCGHTHGGQIVLPWLGAVYVPTRVGRRYASGLHELGGRWLFVNRGLGEVFPPLRFNCPPEIALLTLRSAPASL